MKLFNEKNKHIQAILIILVSAAIIYFVIRPITLNTYTKYLQASKYKSDIDKMKANLQALSTINRINRNYKAEIKLVEEVIPVKSKEQDFIKDLSILCSKNKINLIKTELVHLNDSITFNLELEGSYENVLPLLNDINNMLRLTSIDSLSVTELENAPAGGVVYVKTAGRIFKKHQ